MLPLTSSVVFAAGLDDFRRKKKKKAAVTATGGGVSLHEISPLERTSLVGRCLRVQLRTV